MNSLAASTNGQSINGNKADGGGDNAEENGGVMNNIMSDIQNGFVHRRLPDGGFKVFKINLIKTFHFEANNLLILKVALKPFFDIFDQDR